MADNKDKEQLAAKVKAAIAETLRLPPAQVTSEARFLEDLGASSLDLATLVVMLEDDLDLELPLEELRQLNTVGEVLDLIAAKSAAAGCRQECF